MHSRAKRPLRTQDTNGRGHQLSAEAPRGCRHLAYLVAALTSALWLSACAHGPRYVVRGALAFGGTVLPYGLGWFVQAYGDETLLWHPGLWEGAYSALYLKAPTRQLTLIRSPFVAAFLAAFPR